MFAMAATGAASVSSLLLLGVVLAAAVGLHVLLGRIAKAIAGSVSPLAQGEPEAGGYQRQTALRGKFA